MDARSRWLAAIAAAVGLGIAAATIGGRGAPEIVAIATPIPARWVEHTPVITLPLRERGAFEELAASRIDLGGRNELVTIIRALREGQDAPMATWRRACVVVRDAWLAEYRYFCEGGPTERAPSAERVLQACLALEDVALGETDDWTGAAGSRVVFEVRRELNPSQADNIERTRDWLSSPDASPRTVRAFYGQLVSLFVTRQWGEPEAVAVLRSAEPVSVP